ncbi:isochorismatase family protein [Fluviicola sp.]|jgi:nicotinamidase-related amidase|uniref:cysteine hydrolase family protein n=1 Tax=Fluviicola sp. TaxID=1917219 RepID=UPI002836361F|nr:isochorismatase family protein [Fluviicola sp.]MDR0802898.1 isochorismatase family protein [Fluviicola sp.]
MEKAPFQSALLVMDFQSAILSRYPETSGIIPNVLRAIGHARAQQLSVIYIRVGFRTGAPEINPMNKLFGASKQLYASIDPEDFMRLTSELAPRESEPVITKNQLQSHSASQTETLQ